MKKHLLSRIEILVAQRDQCLSLGHGNNSIVRCLESRIDGIHEGVSCIEAWEGLSYAEQDHA